ncbi:Protein Y41E3.18 [Aphelenchoides avenae]|nr:Protein Y41E3.18 [Aphelenchus avenae]
MTVKRWSFVLAHDCLPIVRNVEPYILRTERNSYIACVMVRSPHAHPRYTLLFSHQNGYDLSDILQLLQPRLQDIAGYLNCNICAYDYSGYGISSGRATEANVGSDIAAVYKDLTTTRHIPPGKLVLWGASIGTAPSVNLAASERGVAGVVLFSPPTSIIRTLCWARCRCCPKPCAAPARNFCGCDKFNTLEKIVNVKAPVLIVHGANDVLVPVEHGQALYNQCPTAVPPLWVPNAGHDDLSDNAVVWKRFRNFIRK